MIDLDWKSNMVSSELPNNKSPKLSLSDKPNLSVSIPPLPLSICTNNFSPAASTLCSAYDHYLRLPHLRKLWASKEFPNWSNELILKPALQALEITFRFISTVLLDPRPYSNRREWCRRVESLAAAQIEIIAMLCEDEEEDPETRGNAPTADLSNSAGSSRSYSETSLLPRLATWYKSKDIGQRILCTVEYQMRRCPYTLGLGEANVAGKRSLCYDAVCKPDELHNFLKNIPYDHIENHENQTLYATHQIIESWTRVAHKLLDRITERIDKKSFEKATKDAYGVERIWKLLTDIEDLHLLMDPDDFLKLKNQLAIKSEITPFCFRSTELVEVTKLCKDLKHKVPGILEVEVDPKGGPRIQEAAMKLYKEKIGGFEKIHLLQAMQAIESATKRFFFAYKQVLVVMMGSLEANGNRIGLNSEAGDPLSQIFLQPTYFPSLDAAKTFLGYFWDNDNVGVGVGLI